MDYSLSAGWTIVLVTAAAWELTWKGAALWRAAQKNQPAWFIALLVINSAGILPMIYILIKRGDS